MTAWPTVTVAILTWNGEKYLDDILSALESQEYPADMDVLVVDSGSTDGTLDIVARYPRVRLHRIPNSEFGHGRTRNLAAELATGEVVAYLTHDAVPLGPGWLRGLVEPIADDPRVVAVVGKQVPRPTCHPLLKYEIRSVFAGLGPDFGVTWFDRRGGEPSTAERDAMGFYSDVNSAARRDVLRGPVPYRDVSYAEDQLFGRDLIDAGYRKAYAPAGAVEHSNDLTVRGSGLRMIDEVTGLRAIGTEIPVLSRRGVVARIVRGVLLDSARILLDRDYGPVRKLRWLVVNPAHHVAKWTAYRRATLLPVEREIPVSRP